jgi:HlyD family secretion protein
MKDAAPSKSPWRWILGALAVAAVAAALFAFRGSSQTAVPATKPVRKDLVVSIASDGSLEPPPGGELRAPAAATVREIFVAEGQRVTRGSPLVRLDQPGLEQSALTARSGAVALSEDRARAAAELDSARGESEHLRGVVDSDRRLVAQSALARATLEADELAYRQSQDRVRQAEAHVESLEGRSSRVRLADESARELEGRVAALLLRAPSDGIVYGLPRKAGETVAAGQLVVSVADPQHLRVRARVDQPDLPRVAPGQKMAVTFDGLPDRRWEGRVVSVPSGITEVGGRQVGEVLGEISDPALSLPPNAAVNVQVVTGEKRGVLTIPRGALQREGSQRYVWVSDRGRARRRPVTVGLVGLSDVEVTNGLSEIDQVLIPGPAALSEGARVAAAGR